MSFRFQKTPQTIGTRASITLSIASHVALPWALPLHRRYRCRGGMLLPADPFLCKRRAEMVHRRRGKHAPRPLPLPASSSPRDRQKGNGCRRARQDPARVSFLILRYFLQNRARTRFVYHLFTISAHVCCIMVISNETAAVFGAAFYDKHKERNDKGVPTP